MGDMISRQDAIGAIDALHDQPNAWLDQAVEAVERLPSAESEKHTGNARKTRACDLISRQSAIDAVCMEWCNVKHKDCKHPFGAEKDDSYWCDGCETVLRTLPYVPSAEPERKAGKWKLCTDEKYDVDYYVCSNCGYEPYRKMEISNYCPNCGAYMGGDKDEID